MLRGPGCGASSVPHRWYHIPILSPCGCPRVRKVYSDNQRTSGGILLHQGRRAFLTYHTWANSLPKLLGRRSISNSSKDDTSPRIAISGKQPFLF